MSASGSMEAIERAHMACSHMMICMLKLIVELFVILLVVYAVLYAIEPTWAHRILNAVLGTKLNMTTTTITIPYAGIQHAYVNGTIQSTSYVFSNDTVLYIKGENNKIIVMERQAGVSIPVLYVNMTGSGDSLTIKNGFVVLNIWGSADSIMLYNSTLLSSNLHGGGDHIYNESASGNQTIYNST